MKPIIEPAQANLIVVQGFLTAFGMLPLWIIALVGVAFLERCGLLKPILRLIGKALIALIRRTINASPALPDDIRAVDTMDGRAFEIFLKNLFERQGYEVHLTPYQGDWGGDLVISRAGVKTVVQAKRYTSRCAGVDGVQQVVAAKAVYGCTEALVVTSSQFTQQARQLARANGVHLWDRDALAAQLRTTPLRAGETSFAAPPSPELSFFGIVPLVPCARCGKLVSRRVEQYCRSQPARFRGQVYCLDHQREFTPFESDGGNSEPIQKSADGLAAARNPAGTH